MIQVLSAIEHAAKEFEKRPYFRLLEGPGSRRDVQILVPAATFFVFAFQDMLRLNYERVQDPEIKKIARQHRMEDAGHELWFISDMRKLGVERDIVWLFSKHHRATRDASLELIGEVLHADDDYQRIAIPLVLEAGGHVYFSRIFHFFERCGVDSDLEYFAEAHWRVEQAHEVFDVEQGQTLERMVLSGAVRKRAIDMAARMFASMTRMVDDIHAQIEASRRGAPRSDVEVRTN
jgi:hypothetical protein